MIKIEEIATFQLTDGLPHVIVRVRDSEGIVGLGECWWGIPTPDDRKRGGAPIVAACLAAGLCCLFIQLSIADYYPILLLCMIAADPAT